MSVEQVNGAGQRVEAGAERQPIGEVIEFRKCKIDERALREIADEVWKDIERRVREMMVVQKDFFWVESLPREDLLKKLKPAEPAKPKPKAVGKK